MAVKAVGPAEVLMEATTPLMMQKLKVLAHSGGGSKAVVRIRI